MPALATVNSKSYVSRSSFSSSCRLISMQVVMFTPVGESIKTSILLSPETVASTKNKSLFSRREATIVSISSAVFMLSFFYTRFVCRQAIEKGTFGPLFDFKS